MATAHQRLIRQLAAVNETKAEIAQLEKLKASAAIMAFTHNKLRRQLAAVQLSQDLVDLLDGDKNKKK